MLFKVITSLAALLAVFVYRSGRVAWNHILTAPDLPDAYYVGGNWTSHCSLVKDPSNDINFCEDISFWDHYDAHGALTNRHVLLGCDPNRQAWNTVMGPLRDPNPRGHLFLYVPSTDTVHRLKIEGYPVGHDFHPLGMEIYPSHNGSPSNLFIVNHARVQTTIEQFVLDPAHLTEARYIRTLRSPYFVSPNAIALTSPTSFYVSNDHLLTRRLPNPIGHVVPLVETIAGLPLSWVSHVSVHESQSPSQASQTDNVDTGADHTLSHTFAALGISFANGIALSPSHTHLAIASTSLGLVHFYTLGATTSSLVFSHSVPVPFFPDNIAYDDDGVLIVTGHPHFPSLVDVAANKTGSVSPSWVVSLTPLSDTASLVADRDVRAPLSASKFVPPVTTEEVETVFQSDGSVFGSSSTTLRDASTGVIYVVGLYERGMLVCRP